MRFGPGLDGPGAWRLVNRFSNGRAPANRLANLSCDGVQEQRDIAEPVWRTKRDSDQRKKRSLLLMTGAGNWWHWQGRLLWHASLGPHAWISESYGCKYGAPWHGDGRRGRECNHDHRWKFHVMVFFESLAARFDVNSNKGDGVIKG